MVRFDWEKILEVTGGNLGEIMTIFQRAAFRDAPEIASDPMHRYVSMDLTGYSYLLNPVDLVIAAETQEETLTDTVNYIAIASLRNLHRFWEYGEVFLPLELFPGDQALLTDNRLIKVEQDKILFKYEVNRLGNRRST